MKLRIVLLDSMPQIHLDNFLGQTCIQYWSIFHIASIFVKISEHVDIFATTMERIGCSRRKDVRVGWV